MKTILQLSLIFALFAQTGLMAQNSQYVLNFDGGVGDDTETQSLKYSDDATTSMLDGATSYTIEMWVKPNSLTESGKVMMSWRNGFRLTFWSNNRFYFTHKDNSSGTVVNTFFNSVADALTIDAWNHIAVICDATDGASGSVKLYVNGVDKTAISDDEGPYDAKSLVGGEDNNDIFVGYGGGNYPNMQAREIRVKKVAVPVANLITDINGDNYPTDANTAVLFHFAEGSGITTLNSASGVNANFGYSGAHYPTWVELSTTLSAHKYNTTTFSIFPNPSVAKEFVIQANSNETIQKVEMFDILGKAVKTIDFSNNISSTNIDVQNLHTGIYFVKTSTDKGIGTRKIIIR